VAQRAVRWAIRWLFLLLTGVVRQQEGHGPVTVGPVQTNYLVPIPWLHEQVERDPRLTEEGKKAEREKAVFNFAWLTAPGTAVFLAALVSMVMLRMNARQVRAVLT